MGNAGGRTAQIHPIRDWRTVNGDTVFKVFQPLNIERFQETDVNRESYITRLGFNDTSERRLYTPSEIKLSDIELYPDDEWDDITALGGGSARRGILKQDVIVKLYGETWVHRVGSIILLLNLNPMSDTTRLDPDGVRLRKLYGTRILKLMGDPDKVVVSPRRGGRRRRTVRRRRFRKNLRTRRARK